eukprot:m.265330 g.265330  ORF g.265330 m.265330 type:complete len:696 (-) comp19259_c0_seq2:331-2418(-)
MEKSKLAQLDMLQQVQEEKRILSLMRDGEFVVSLQSSWQDSKQVCFLMPYITGGDLFDAIRAAKRLTPERAARYTLQMGQALDFLWSKRVMYRDLKLENVMVDDTKDACILCDFGLSKRLPKKSNRTSTICGTVEYMSPEILKGQAYGHEVDWWSLGVVAFAMITGKYPFASGVGKLKQDKSAEDRSLMYERIAQGLVTYPDWLAPDICNSLAMLLEIDPEVRVTRSDALRRTPWLSVVTAQSGVKSNMQSRRTSIASSAAEAVTGRADNGGDRVSTEGPNSADESFEADAADLFDMIAKFQSKRLDDQRAPPPAASLTVDDGNRGELNTGNVSPKSDNEALTLPGPPSEPRPLLAEGHVDPATKPSVSPAPCDDASSTHDAQPPTFAAAGNVFIDGSPETPKARVEATEDQAATTVTAAATAAAAATAPAPASATDADMAVATTDADKAVAPTDKAVVEVASAVPVRLADAAAAGFGTAASSAASFVSALADQQEDESVVDGADAADQVVVTELGDTRRDSSVCSRRTSAGDSADCVGALNGVSLDGCVGSSTATGTWATTQDSQSFGPGRLPRRSVSASSSASSSSLAVLGVDWDQLSLGRRSITSPSLMSWCPQVKAVPKQDTHRHFSTRPPRSGSGKSFGSSPPRVLFPSKRVGPGLVEDAVADAAAAVAAARTSATIFDLEGVTASGCDA